MGSDWGTAGGLKLCVALERDCVLEGCTLYVNHNKVVKDCFAFKEIQDSKLNEGIKLMVCFLTFQNNCSAFVDDFSQMQIKKAEQSPYRCLLNDTQNLPNQHWIHW